MRNSADYYELLHLQPDAPPALIKASFRTLMQKLKMHPDLGGEAKLASQLNVAYETLCDPDLRAEYDRTLEVAHSLKRRAPKTKPAPIPDVPRIMWPAGTSKSAAQCLFCNTRHSFNTYPPRGALCSHCECPLATANGSELLVGERRVLERLSIERHIQYRSTPDATMQHANTSDLSLNGLKFSAAHDLINNQLIQIQSPFCLSLARIAHVASAPSPEQEFGVEFVTLCFPQATGSLVSTHA